jgi:hypothetical protein
LNTLQFDVAVIGAEAVGAAIAREFHQYATLQLFQSGRVLCRKKMGCLAANTSLPLSGEWVENLHYSAEPVNLSYKRESW